MKITKETLYRAFRTFLQSAIAFIAVNGMYVNLSGEVADSKGALEELLISAIAAGLSAAMNLEKEDTLV